MLAHTLKLWFAVWHFWYGSPLMAHSRVLKDQGMKCEHCKTHAMHNATVNVDCTLQLSSKKAFEKFVRTLQHLSLGRLLAHTAASWQVFMQPTKSCTLRPHMHVCICDWSFGVVYVCLLHGKVYSRELSPNAISYSSRGSVIWLQQHCMKGWMTPIPTDSSVATVLLAIEWGLKSHQAWLVLCAYNSTCKKPCIGVSSNKIPATLVDGWLQLVAGAPAQAQGLNPQSLTKHSRFFLGVLCWLLEPA